MSFLKKKIFNKTTVLQNLVTIFGIGSYRAKTVCQKIGVNPTGKFLKLRPDQKNKIFFELEATFPNIEKELKLFNKNNGIFYKKLKSYRSKRNLLGLPSRGQRTHTNAKTKARLHKSKSNL